MTLNVKRWFKRGGKIETKKKLPRKDYLMISQAMNKFSPGMTETAMMQKGDKYIISFDASGHNLLLEKELRRLRNKIGLNFDYYVGKDISSSDDIQATNLTRSKIQDRLFVEFSPVDDIEWSYLRGIFGLPSGVTTEVSEEQPVETISDR